MIAAGIAVAVLVGTFATLWLLQRSAPPPVMRTPVPWIDDAAWQKLTPRGSLARRAAGLVPGSTVIAPLVTQTTPDDLERVPQMVVPSDAALPPPGSLAEQRERLLGTPGGGRLVRAVWPVCCDRLATLISTQQGDRLAAIESRAGPLDRAFLAGELATWGGPNADRRAMRDAGWSAVLERMRTGRHSGMGINIFQCRACGRVYVASCAP